MKDFSNHSHDETHITHNQTLLELLFKTHRCLCLDRLWAVLPQSIVVLIKGRVAADCLAILSNQGQENCSKVKTGTRCEKLNHLSNKNKTITPNAETIMRIKPRLKG